MFNRLAVYINKLLDSGWVAVISMAAVIISVFESGYAIDLIMQNMLTVVAIYTAIVALLFPADLILMVGDTQI